MILIGSGIALALFFLRHPRKVIETEKAEAASSHDEDLGRIVTQAHSPKISIEVSQTSAADIKPSVSQAPKAMTLKEFKGLAINALKTLPKQVPKKNLTEEQAHHLTLEGLDEVQPLADIAAAVAENPELKKPAFAFYNKCASDNANNLAWTVRSQCLTEMRTLAPQLGNKEQDETDHALRSVDPSIKLWSDKLIE